MPQGVDAVADPRRGLAAPAFRLTSTIAGHRLRYARTLERLGPIALVCRQAVMPGPTVLVSPSPEGHRWSPGLPAWLERRWRGSHVSQLLLLLDGFLRAAFLEVSGGRSSEAPPLLPSKARAQYLTAFRAPVERVLPRPCTPSSYAVRPSVISLVRLTQSHDRQPGASRPSRASATCSVHSEPSDDGCRQVLRPIPQRGSSVPPGSVAYRLRPFTVDRVLAFQAA